MDITLAYIISLGLIIFLWAYTSHKNRKRKELSLANDKQSNENFDQIFQTNALGLVLFSRQGIVLRINPRATEELSHVELELGKNVKDLFPEETVEDFLNKEKFPTQFHLRARAKETTKYLEIQISEILYHEEACYLAFVKDISKKLHEQKLIQEQKTQLESEIEIQKFELQKSYSELEESQQKFSELANLLPQTIFETDINGNLEFVNSFALEFNQYSKAEFEAGLNLKDLVEQSDLPRMKRNFELAISGKGNSPNQYSLRKKNGEIYPALIYSSPIKKNKTSVGLRGICVDLSNRKKHLDELNKLSQAIEQSPFAIMLVGADGLVEYVNLKFETLTGYRGYNLVGKPYLSIYPNDKLKTQIRNLIKNLPENKDARLEFQNKTKNGKNYWERLVISQIAIDKESPSYYLLVKEDISNQIESSENLRMAMNKAEEANRSKSLFLANMSHEIRTPMNSVLGFSDLLLADINTEPFVTYLQSIKNSSKSLLNILNDILDISKIESGKLELAYQYFDVKRLFEELNEIFQIAASKKGLKLNMSISDNIPGRIRLDELRLKQILTNLLSNAIKFTETGNVELHVHTNIKSLKQLSLRIEVKDTGIGLRENDIKSVFETFTQKDSKASRKYEGTGLGLTITKSLVEKMNGEIRVRSIWQKGSSFEIEFPTVFYEEHNSEEKKKAESNNNKLQFKGKVALIIDDVEDNRLFMKNVLRKFGFRSEIAHHGADALKKLEQLTPDLIMCDLYMPIIDGFEFIKKVREQSKLQHIPVIANSANAFPDTVERVEQSKFDGFVSKPILIPELGQLIEKLMLPKEISQEKKKITSPQMSEDIRQQVLLLLEGDLYERYEEFKVKQPINELSDFSKELEEIGQKHRIDFIEDFGKELCQATEQFNVEGILSSINNYPQLINRLKIQS